MRLSACRILVHAAMRSVHMRGGMRVATNQTLARHSAAGCCAAWVAFAALFLTAAIAHAADAGRQPNVVLVMTDNHGAWTLGCYGNREIKTPNIDRLAAEGMLFTRAYCTHSLCSPSRATFLTGLIPSQHGLHYTVTEAKIGRASCRER